MENIGIYLFALIVLVWPAVTFLVAGTITTSQWASVDDYDYSPVARNTNPSVTVAPTPTYAKSSDLLPTSKTHIRTS